MEQLAGSPGSAPVPTSEQDPSPIAAPFVERRKGDGGRLRPPTPRVALVLLGALLVLCVLYLGREALSPFVVGLLLVYLLDPPVERLTRTRLPRPAAILAVYGAALLLVVEAINLTLRPVADQLTRFSQDLPGLIGQLDHQLQRLSEVYRGLELPAQVRSAIDEWLASVAAGQVGFDPGVLLPVVNLTAGFVSSLFGYLVIPVWAFYLLKDRRPLVEAFDRMLPAEWRTDVWEVIQLSERVLGQWIRGQLVLGLTVGVGTFAGLLILDVAVDPVFGRFALLLALIAGALELLPIIGPIIAAVPAILLAATASPQATVAAVILYIVVQQLENNLLVPKIQGDAVALHPSAVMFALVVGGAIAGLLGAILALPITAAARDVFAYLFRRLSDPLVPAEVAAEAAFAGHGQTGEPGGSSAGRRGVPMAAAEPVFASPAAGAHVAPAGARRPGTSVG
jgi:predicted PurR-regulated permease PerM